MSEANSLNFDAAVESVIAEEKDPVVAARVRDYFDKCRESVPPIEYVQVLAPNATELVTAVRDPKVKCFEVGHVSIFNRARVRITAIVNGVIHLEEIDEDTFNQARCLQAHAQGDTTH